MNDGVIGVGRGRALGTHRAARTCTGTASATRHLGSTRAAALERGSRVIAGAGDRARRARARTASHRTWSSRSGPEAGRAAIDPKPILDGWKLLEATAIYRANGENVLRGGASLGQMLLLSKSLLAKRVLADERIDVYECGREDIRAGLIDRRVLADTRLPGRVRARAHGHLIALRPRLLHEVGQRLPAQLRQRRRHRADQRHPGDGSSGARRHHRPGGAPAAQLQGALAPTQIISLFDIGGTTLSMADHADHIHVGFQPAGGAGRAGHTRC